VQQDFVAFGSGGICGSGRSLPDRSTSPLRTGADGVMTRCATLRHPQSLGGGGRKGIVFAVDAQESLKRAGPRRAGRRAGAAVAGGVDLTLFEGIVKMLVNSCAAAGAGAADSGRAIKVVRSACLDHCGSSSKRNHRLSLPRRNTLKQKIFAAVPARMIAIPDAVGVSRNIPMRKG